MSILELLTTVFFICSTPDNGCRSLVDKEKKSITYFVCVNDSSPSSDLPSFDLGVIDLNKPDNYRYITIQPISCTEV